MNFSKLTDNLSELRNRFFGNKNLSKLSFCCGELISQMALTCKQLCPYSKLAIIFSERSFDEYGKTLSQALKANGLSPINVIIEQSKAQAQDLESSLPENVRLVLTVDENLIDFCQDLSQRLNLPLVVGLKRLPNKILYSIDLVEPIHFVFSDKLSVDVSKVYEKAVSMIISLLDIKLKQFFKIIPRNFELEEEFLNRLDRALYFANEQELLQDEIALELLEGALGHNSEQFELKSSLTLLKLATENLKDDYPFLPNYVERAKMAKEFGKDYYKRLLAIKSQLDLMKEYAEQLKDIEKGISALASIYSQNVCKIISNFKRLRGKASMKTKEVLKELKYAGDKYYYINIATLLREKGCLEYSIV